MLPPGHIAGGVLLEAWGSHRGSGRPSLVIAGAVAATTLPDLDLAIPSLLDRLAGVTDHAEYARRYPSSPAGRLEIALVLAALAVFRPHRHAA